MWKIPSLLMLTHSQPHFKVQDDKNNKLPSRRSIVKSPWWASNHMGNEWNPDAVTLIWAWPNPKYRPGQELSQSHHTTSAAAAAPGRSHSPTASHQPPTEPAPKPPDTHTWKSQMRYCSHVSLRFVCLCPSTPHHKLGKVQEPAWFCLFHSSSSYCTIFGIVLRKSLTHLTYKFHVTAV